MEFPHGQDSHTDTHPPKTYVYRISLQPPQQPHVTLTHTYDHETLPGQDYSSSYSPSPNYPYYRTPTTEVTVVVRQKNHHPVGFFLDKPSFKVYCKADPGFSLAIRDGKVVVARSDPSDLSQNWFKDEKYSTRVKDEWGFPSFALVNKATGQAMKHSIGETQPVQLIPYNPDVLDESILWAQAEDLGEGYRAIRMVNNTSLNVDAFQGGDGVHEGTPIVLWKWLSGRNQQWKIVPQCKFHVI